MNPLTTGALVINPEAKKPDDQNHVGEIEEIHTFVVAPKLKYAWVKFKTYSTGFNLKELKPYKIK